MVYSFRVVTIKPANHVKLNTELIVDSPENLKRFSTSIFQWDEINELNTGQQRLWIELLNKSFQGTTKIPKNQALGFVVIEPDHFKFTYEMSAGKKEKAIQKKKTTLSKKIKQKSTEETWRLS